MQRLLAFWNRSLINKLIVLAAPFCFCCVPISAVGNRGQGAASIPATQSQATALPATVPEPTSAPAPNGGAVAYASGGLGLARADWEAREGAPTREAGGMLFYGPTRTVMFFDAAVWHIEQSMPDGTSVESARELARPLLPDDAQFVENYTTDRDQVVDLWHSATLAAQFPGDEWVGGKPGDHIVIYRGAETGSVIGIVIGTGNNP